MHCEGSFSSKELGCCGEQTYWTHFKLHSVDFSGSVLKATILFFLIKQDLEPSLSKGSMDWAAVSSLDTKLSK